MRPSRTVLVVGTIALLLASPIVGVAIARGMDDRPLLQEVRTRALPLFEETARLIDPAFAPRPHPGSDPKGPLGIANDPLGYQDCDAWRDWILPGWSAGTWHDFEVANDEERREIIDRVRALWEQQKGELTVREASHWRPLELHIDEISYSLTFPVNSELPVIPDGSVSVGIGCLPVD